MSYNTRTINQATCFGEMLWDVLPGNVKPGGAPMNVAYHLHQLGVQSNIVSRIGDDKRGAQLIKILEGWGLPEEFVQEDPIYATSEVIARMDEHHEMNYEIVFPVAWDFIEWKDEFRPLLATSDAFVYGSLATRNKVTYQTLLAMLELATFKVFDVNLRHPHYTEEIIKNLLLKADLLKLNQAELDIICTWIKPDIIHEKEKISLLQNTFSIEEIILTKGSKGATCYAGDAAFNSKVYPVKVADTVGSGDAFLAAFLATKSDSDSIKKQLNYASALGAFVASKEGACPDYNKEELEKFISSYDN